MTITITTLDQLQAVQNDLSEDYVLGNDIDASATSGWNGGQGWAPFGAFSGTFDGKGYVISRLYINCNNKGYVGLFGLVYGTVKNVGVTDASITATRGGPTHAGVLVGELWGGILDCCYTTGTIALTVTAAQHNHANCGGLVGICWNAAGTIRECSSSANVTSTGVNAVKAHGGGLVGLLGGIGASTIKDCYARGSVYAIKEYYIADAGGLVGNHSLVGSIDNCYSTGAVTGNSNTGGLVGHTNGAPSNTDSFWDTQTSGQSTSGGGTGHTTAWMKTKSNFVAAGWDFETIWLISAYQNGGYPCLLCVEVSFRGLFVRGDEIQAIFCDGLGIRSPDFGDTWYALYNLPVGAADVGFDVDNPQNSFVGCIGALYVFDYADGGNYYYVLGATIDGTTSRIDVDLNSDVGVIGTISGVYKTLDYGHTVYKWLNQPSPAGVAIGGHSLASGES